MSDPRTDRPAGRQVPPKGTDEGSFVSCPARRQCPPNTTAASAATYPLRCFAPQWARFDNRHSISAPDPTLAPRQRQRRKRYKRSPEPTTSPAAPIPRSQHRQIRTCPPRAKEVLKRSFKWFSLVTFFLQKKESYSCRSTKLPIPRPQAQHLLAAGAAPPPARAFLLSPTAPFLPTAEEMGERTPAETAFLHFLSALRLFAAARAFPHVTGVFLIVVGPPTVPAQLSAAAARYYGKKHSFCCVAG